MRVIGTGALSNFSKKYPNCKKWIDCWLADMRGLPVPFLPLVLQRYPSVQRENLRGLVFKFQADGVQYYMKVKVAEGTGILTVKWVGTAVEYICYQSEENHGN
ncbi:hypothetical protein ACPJXG_00120 [Janthinobacterium sp. NFX145]|uniref:hypothetical protein n=1 Tax=Janthinobacterium sp. NFX145 TaxID=3415602 RepID=UPI003CC653A3